MMKFLLATAAVLATIASVHADEISELRKADEEARVKAAAQKYAYECVITKITPKDKDSDPSYKVNVVVNNTGFVNVWHTTASGKEYDRAKQYNKDQRTGPARDGEDWNTSPLLWLGIHNKSADISMIGKIGTWKQNGIEKMFYFETVYKKVKGKHVPVTSIESACHPIQLPA